MTQELRAAGALGGAFVALLAIGLPLMILLALDPASQAACGGTPTGPGPSSVPGIPQNLLPIFEGASQQFALGSDGWAYLAALNNAESTLRHQQRTGHRRAFRLQLCRRGRADADRDRRAGDRQLGHRGRRDPAEPARRRAAADRLQRGRRRLRRRRSAAQVGSARGLAGRARGVEQLPARDRAGDPARGAVHPWRGEQRHLRHRHSHATTSAPAAGRGCAPISGPTTPGAVAKILPNGPAAIPTARRHRYRRRSPPATASSTPSTAGAADEHAHAGSGLLRLLGTLDFAAQLPGLVSYAAGRCRRWRRRATPSCLRATASRAPGSGSPSGAPQGHAFIEVAGIVLDTARYAPVQPASVPDSFPADDPANGGPQRPAVAAGVDHHGSASRRQRVVNPPPLKACDPPSDPPRPAIAGVLAGCGSGTHTPRAAAGSVDARIVTVGDSERNKDEPRGPASPSLLQVARTFTAAYAHSSTPVSRGGAARRQRAGPCAARSADAGAGSARPARRAVGSAGSRWLDVHRAARRSRAPLHRSAHGRGGERAAGWSSGSCLRISTAWSGRRRERSPSPPDRPRRRRPRAGSCTAICRGCTGRGRSRRSLTPPPACSPP